jgi:DNA-binding response OmpR family regulator
MKKRILVVDDEKDIVDLVCARLKAAGYDTITAYDGEEGLEKARTGKPDLIILDLMLPKMDGYAVCLALKSDPNYRDIPIIMFTARYHENDIKMGQEIGADAYVIKPYDANILMANIQALIK